MDSDMTSFLECVWHMAVLKGLTPFCLQQDSWIFHVLQELNDVFQKCALSDASVSSLSNWLAPTISQHDQWCWLVCKPSNYPLVICYVAVDNVHRNSEFSNEQLWFSIIHRCHSYVKVYHRVIINPRETRSDVHQEAALIQRRPQGVPPVGTVMLLVTNTKHVFGFSYCHGTCHHFWSLESHKTISTSTNMMIFDQRSFTPSTLW